MEWLTCIRSAIDYMEDHLTDDISAQDVADQVYLSPFFLQKGFSVMTGMGIGEYIRNRRLYLAACELKDTDDKVIDIALRYGYETPESFTKAFTRFHKATPSQVRSGAAVTAFLPLTIKLSIQGGYQMDYKIAPMFPFKVIGFQKVFDMEDSYQRIPEFWDEICAKYAANVYAGNAPANPYEQALVDNCIGEYGVCIDDIGGGKFRYLIAGKYTGGEVPEGMVVYEFPKGEWAVFNCIGPNPETLQRVSSQIFREWLPGNPEYELCGNATVEWYDCVNGEMSDPDYHSAVWVPVRKRQQQ
ncbi:MAG: AraC family transcriptional regulator [Eubacteriaceae bacterium]|nr:AraC family transcriptional regulator [Eubacteriaceae bacterium]